MILDILTPEAQIFHGTVEYVSLPGQDGEFQVLQGHAAIISALKKGMVRLKSGSEASENVHLTKTEKEGEYGFNIRGGVAEMLGDKIVVLAE